MAGHSLDAATVMIRDALGHAYRDLDKLSVTLKERKLPVTVLGYVKTPGDVELAGDANVQTALVAAGGISQGAQLDRMTVTHADGKKEQFDYKKYLDSGDPSTLAAAPAARRPLCARFALDRQRADRVRRPHARVHRATAPRRARRSRSSARSRLPATFAYRKGATVIDMIMRAGGVTRYSAPEQIRILNNSKPVVFNLQAYLDTGDKSLLPDVEPGATIYVPKQVEEVRSGKLTVYVMGEVAKPGAFDARDGASFIDVIANAGGPTRYADTRQIHIIRADGTIENVDLVKYADGSGGKLPGVRPGDAIFVPEKNDSAEQPSWLKIAPTRAVQVIGALYKPGRYEWSDEMSIFDLLSNAGGPTAHADIAHIQILRKDGDKAAPVTFDLDTFLKGGGSLKDVPKIHAGYVIMFRSCP